jgi:glutamate-1-semialdehyde aminotransferase/3-oxoacyl-(acyl-carrier-protein) synthase/acyl carrier protein/SAM-dependent methyltransferase
MNEQPDLRASLKAAIEEIESLQAHLDASEAPVAIIGVGCRLPGAEGVEEAWARLRAGDVACGDPPAIRASIAAAFDPDPEAPGRTYCAKAAYLDGLEMFDAGFFRLLPAQARALDPQQRMLLETSWSAIEDAGLDPAWLKGGRTGVYVGLSFDDYAARAGGDGRMDPASTLGVARSLAAGRISYFFDFNGPCVQLDTACSSAAVALHQATRALRAGECDLALAGGANAIIGAETMARLSKLKALSPQGRCRSFEASADGYGRGEGAVMFLLSRLPDAEARNHRIHAVIRGSSVNHDGASNGLTAPNRRAQEAVVRAALEDAQASPADVAFVEAHGTGTPLGDPIEAAALADVFAGRGQGEVLLGSSKALFGHLEAAAGALGVLKAALSLREGVLPAQPRETEPTPRIDWASSPLRLALQDAPLPPSTPLAGVSSFGMSGTNVHIVLERPPEPHRPAGETAGLAFVSAGGKAALRRRAGELARWISSHPEAATADLERSLLARAGLSHRAVFAMEDPRDLAERLQAFAEGDAAAALASGTASREEPPPAIASWADREGVIAAFVGGAPIDPVLAARHPGRPLSLPPYPFERSRYWIADAQASQPAAQAAVRGPQPPDEPPPAASGDVKAGLRDLLSRMLGLPAGAIGERTPFVELGADSLILLDAVRAIEQRYGVSIPMGQLFAGLSTIEALSAYVADRREAAPQAEPAGAQTVGPAHPAPAAVEADPTGQSHYFEGLVEAHARRHAGSKARAASSRSALADSRRAVGFRPSLKEALFPIVGERGEGAWFWDVDGNRFVDIAMGFGVYLFGHRHAPVEAAIEAARREGLPIGPQSRDAGDVAETLCRLTGFERAAFCNTGTEAVMTALRLARAATRRSGVALFSGSYHGHFDGVLGASGGALGAVPATPGVTPAFVSDLMVLDYGSEAALEAIERHGGSLAAVLVEPVQSRNPGLQPAAFLRRLRELADRLGFALVFDEVLTGLRVHPAGAQGLLGVKPDIATYGKILGGGLPVGAVAGAARFLDGIDGGAWDYGDRSAPLADRVFFGGTFNKNALSMAAAKAVLGELERAGPALQEDLNARTDAMVRRIQERVRAEGFPVSVQHFGSLFRFGFSRNPDAFYLELACRGVYVWEGRNCFLSTAHDEAAVDHLVGASLDSLRSMRAGGLLDPPAQRPAPSPAPTSAPAPAKSALAPPRAVAASLAVAGPPSAGPEHGERTRQLDLAATGFAVQALRLLGAETGLGERVDPERLAERLGASEAGRRLTACLVGWLAKDGLIEPAGDAWRWRPDQAAPDIAAALEAARSLGGQAEAALLERAGGALAEVLRRSRHALDALAPGGDFTALSDVYVRPALARAANRLLGEACRELAAAVPDGATLDILEIGAGTGSATRALLEALGERPLRYRATDVSSAFFDPGHWAHPPDARLSFGRYDIDRPALEQGLPEAGFDLIVASNALHVAHDLDVTLGQIASLLKPGGVLVLDELTAAPRWLQLTFGITEGWWSPSDARRRAGTPLLSAAGWEAALAAAGLPLTASVVPGGNADEAGAAIIMAQKHGVCDASRAQQELVALAAVDEDGAAAYNLALVVDLDGEIDADRLVRSIVEEARAHDALSAVFIHEPIRMVFGAAPVGEAARPDLGAEPDPAAADLWCTQFADAPFDLGAGPLFRSAVLQLGAGRLRAVLAAPHVVADAMSLAVVWEGAMRRYGGGPPGPAPSFAEHLAAERRWLATPEAEAQRSFWRPRLPAAGPRGEAGWDGGVVQSPLGEGLAGAVRRRAAASGLTSFMLCFAAFALLVDREGDERARVVGVPVSGRRRAPEGLVGYCTHVLPIAAPAPAAGTVRAWLDGAREALLQAYEHQDLPFAEMRRGSAAQVEVTFNLDIGALSAPGGVRLATPGWRSRREPFPLRVNLTAIGEDLAIEAGYQSACYGAEEVGQLLGRYRDLLQRLCEAADDAPIAQIAPPARAPAVPGLRDGATIVAAVTAGPAEMNDIERCLAEAIGRALNLEAVGPEDDFFELGGDSIVSLQAAAAARRAGYEIDAKAILKHRTVRAMAREAAGVEASAPAPAAAPAPQLTLGEGDYAALASVFED